MRALLHFLRHHRRGAAAVEYVIALPVIFILLFGIIEVGRLFWVQISLDQAVAKAARCGALKTAGCTTADGVKNYATTQAPGITFPLESFTVVYPTGTVVYPACGVEVSGQYTFNFSIPFGSLTSKTLKSYACQLPTNIPPG